MQMVKMLFAFSASDETFRIAVVALQFDLFICCGAIELSIRTCNSFSAPSRVLVKTVGSCHITSLVIIGINVEVKEFSS
jgi:hypothetical protein